MPLLNVLPKWKRDIFLSYGFIYAFFIERNLDKAIFLSDLIKFESDIISSNNGITKMDIEVLKYLADQVIGKREKRSFKIEDISAIKEKPIENFVIELLIVHYSAFMLTLNAGTFFAEAEAKYKEMEGTVKVALLNGRIVGYVWFDFEGSNTISVHELATSTEAKECGIKGIGTALMDETIKVLIEHDIHEIMITSTQSKGEYVGSHPFFEKYFSRRQQILSLNGIRVNLVLGRS